MKKIAYITPHLSTGGLPQYLLRTIELLNDSYEIVCIEYNDYGQYKVQKNKLIKLLPLKFYTLGEDKSELLRMIHELEPDIVHLAEFPEFFMNDDISKNLYNNSRNYLIFETSHDSSFDPNHKKFFPDKFLFCSDNQYQRFKHLDIPSSVIEYPIEDNRHKRNREEGLTKLGLDPNIKHILNVGLLTRRKNQMEIAQYAEQFQNSSNKKGIPKKLHFHCVGGMAPNFESYWREILDFIDERKLENITMWGERSDVDLFYSCMDLFLFPSREVVQGDIETNPLAIKEALSWNLPVLMYNLRTYGDRYENIDDVTFLSPKTWEQRPTIINFNKNLLKIESILGTRNDEKNIFFDCFNDPENPYKIHLHTDTDSYWWNTLKNKMITIEHSDTKAPINKFDFINPYFWCSPSDAIRWVNGNLTFKLWDMTRSEYIESEGNVLTNHALIFEKHFDINDNDNTNAQYLNYLEGDGAGFYTYYEIFIKNEYYQKERFKIEKDDIVVDVGSNIGFASIYAIQKGAKIVHSVEPIKEVFDVSCKNFFGYDNIIPHNIGLASVDGIIDIKYFPEVSTIASINQVGNIHVSSVAKTMSIPVNRFDTFVERNNIDRIDYLKIDCEGGEWEFFPTIPMDFLRYRVRRIVMEVHDRKGEMHDIDSIIFDKLKQTGYEFTNHVDIDDENQYLSMCYARRYPKIKLVHMITNMQDHRQIESVKHLTKLAEETDIDYVKEEYELYTDLPPTENCARPDNVEMSNASNFSLTPAHYGNYMSHKLSILKHLDSEYDGVIFCESDAILIKDPQTVYKEVIDRLDDLNEFGFNYCSFGKRALIHHNEINQYCGTVTQMYEAHFYLINKTSFDYFNDKFQNTLWDTYDLWLNNNVLSENKGLITRKPFSIQSSGQSSLDGSLKDGTTLLQEGDIEYELN